MSFFAIMASDFNLFFIKKLECKGGDLYLIQHSVSHIIKIPEAFDLYDIWRIRTLTFRQKHFSVVLQRKLNYVFISNSLPETIFHVDILNAFSTDHSLIFCSFMGKVLSQKSCEQNADLPCKISRLEQDNDSWEKFEEYDKTRSKLENIYDKIASVKIRSK